MKSKCPVISSADVHALGVAILRHQFEVYTPLRKIVVELPDIVAEFDKAGIDIVPTGCINCFPLKNIEPCKSCNDIRKNERTTMTKLEKKTQKMFLRLHLEEFFLHKNPEIKAVYFEVKKYPIYEKMNTGKKIKVFEQIKIKNLKILYNILIFILMKILK